MIRRIGCAAAILCIWIGVLGWAAGVSWPAPLLPREQLNLAASDFHVVMGGGVEDNKALRVAAVGDDGSALQAIALDHLRARDFPLLRYRFDDFPRSLELSLVFRRADAPEDVQVATVPWPGDGWRSLDLSKVPGWHGQITEIGFAEYATPQIVPAAAAFKPFRFYQAELWSPSWRGSLAALYTSWFGYTPWALLSISALGPQREVAQAPPLVPFAVVACVLSLLAALAILRWSRAQFIQRSVFVACALWVLLDLSWLDDLRAKHLLTETIYAGKPWSEREQLMPDQDIARAAAQVRGYFAVQTSPRRLLVAADSKYVFLKLIYLLLPLDAAPLEQGAMPSSLPGTYVLLFGDSRWRYDPVRGELLDESGQRLDQAAESVFRGGFERPARIEPVYESDGVFMYAFREGISP